MNSTDPITYDVTEGGIVVAVTEEQGFDLTTPFHMTNALRDNLALCKDRLAALQAAIPEMLAELDQALAEIGDPCGICEGTQGHMVEGTDGPEWIECNVCAGSGSREPVAA